MALLFVDIDDFKAFNTEYGHKVGDQVLLFLSSVLGRVTGGVVGRVGGDEFLVVVEAPKHIDSLGTCLENIEQSANSQLVMRGSGIHLPVYCCIGAKCVDFSRGDFLDFSRERLVDMADNAMYQVKNKGKHGHIIYEYNQDNL